MIIHIHRRVPRPRFPVRRGNFGDSATNNGYIAHVNAHARNCLISTSGLKSEIYHVHRSIFLHDAIREHLRQKLAYLSSHGFSGSFDPKWRFWGAK